MRGVPPRKNDSTFKGNRIEIPLSQKTPLLQSVFRALGMFRWLVSNQRNEWRDQGGGGWFRIELSDWIPVTFSRLQSSIPVMRSKILISLIFTLLLVPVAQAQSPSTQQLASWLGDFGLMFN